MHLKYDKARGVGGVLSEVMVELQLNGFVKCDCRKILTSDI